MGVEELGAYGVGYRDGSGYGCYDAGDGDGSGYGDGSRYRDGSGYGDGSWYGDGSGFGDGSWHGDILGYGSGFGDGDGYRDGSGYGDGEVGAFFRATADKWPAVHALTFPHAGRRRELLEIIGPNCLFSQVAGRVVDRDIDLQGNERALLRVECEDAQEGYLQAVRVVCPTTRRVYHLLVPPDVSTCQEGVASTFGLAPEEYNPGRES